MLTVLITFIEHFLKYGYTVIQEIKVQLHRKSMRATSNSADDRAGSLLCIQVYILINFFLTFSLYQSDIWLTICQPEELGGEQDAFLCGQTKRTLNIFE